MGSLVKGVKCKVKQLPSRTIQRCLLLSQHLIIQQCFRT
jgi:hypothetical protein